MLETTFAFQIGNYFVSIRNEDERILHATLPQNNAENCRIVFIIFCDENRPERDGTVGKRNFVEDMSKCGVFTPYPDRKKPLVILLPTVALGWDAMSTASKGMIMEADDIPDDLFILTRALSLSRLGYSIFTVNDGEEAIRYLERESAPALIVLDLKMPKADGLDVLRWMQSRTDLSSVPVVMYSTSILESDRDQALRLGAKDYFVKTASGEQLRKIIADLDARFLKGPVDSTPPKKIAA
jgi:CheY-like chemotaxis protein